MLYEDLQWSRALLSSNQFGNPPPDVIAHRLKFDPSNQLPIGAQRNLRSAAPMRERDVAHAQAQQLLHSELRQRKLQ